MHKMILMKMMNMKLKKIAPELPKEVNRKNDFDNMMRPYSAMPAKNNRIAISAKDKNY